MTSLFKRFPTRIWFIQFVVLVIALFLGLVFYPDPDPTQVIGDGAVVGHDLMTGFPRRELPLRRPKQVRSDTGADSVYEVGRTSDGETVPKALRHLTIVSPF